MNTWVKRGGLAVLVIFALIGLAFTAVYIAMQFGLLNVRGSIDDRNAFFLGGKNEEKKAIPAQPCVDVNQKTCDWHQSPEWVVVAGGLEKDASIIHRVSSETGVSARLIASVVVPEQIRFFTAEREVFKRYFEPLKILGSLSQFSLGVSGIKQETAAEIERHASDPNSPFYPGEGYAALIAYAPGVNHDAELYNRLTDDKNHYYSYLYTAIYIKEIQMQWERAGFPISNKPEIVGTLFNIGFAKSQPKADPQVAGAPVSVGGKSYTFGDLGGRFHTSLELRTVFPL